MYKGNYSVYDREFNANNLKIKYSLDGEDWYENITELYNTDDGKFTPPVLSEGWCCLTEWGELQQILSTPQDFMLLTSATLFLAFLPELISLIAAVKRCRASRNKSKA